MAKKISSKDIFDGRPLKPLIDDAKKTVAELKKLESGLKQVALIAKNDLKNIKLDNFTNVSKASKAVNNIDKSFKGLNQTTKERIKLQGQLKRANSDSIQQNEELRLQLQAQKKTNKELAREKLGLISVYEKESKRLNTLRKNLKDLILTEGEGSKKTKKLALEVGKLDAKLKKADAAAGQFQRNVGNYPKALGRATGALRSFAGALGITAGITGLVRAFGNAVNIFKDFEQGNANLAAVLGKTKSEITALSEDAKRLGATTAFTATQVSGLQVEFAKLGFNENEILAATEATLSLAAATGSDLGEAAAIAGATLGGFGLGAEETQRIVDVMAKSFSTSALDIEKFKESMKNAAPAAKAVGISVEETTALLGTLANAGISGSRAGNNLKTSFINLNKAGLTLEEGLEKVANSENKLGTAAELVGKNAAASFLVLSEGVDVTKELTTGLNNAGGAAEKMAKEQLDTLGGSLTILNSAWEGFILSLEDGQGAFAKTARGIIDVVTELLSLLSGTAKAKEELNGTELALRETAEAVINVAKVLGVLITSFLAYKTAVVATNIATKVAAAVQAAYSTVVGLVTGKIKLATIATKLFNAATKANPIGLVITAVTALVSAFFLFRGEQDKVTESTIKWTQAEREALKVAKERVVSLARSRELFNKLIKDQNADLRDFNDAQLEAAKVEAERQLVRRKDLAQRQVASDIIAKIESEQLRRTKELNELRETEDVTLSKLREQLRNLKTEKEEINIIDTEALANKKQEIIDLQAQIDLIDGNTKSRKKLKKEKDAARRTDAEIQKERQARFDLEFDRDKQRDKENQDRLDEASERQDQRNKERLAKERGTAAEEERIQAERIENAIRASNIISEAFSDALTKVFDEQERALDASIKRREDKVSSQQSRAENGLENTLAFEKGQLAKAERERAELAEKRARQEEALALAQTYLNFVQARAASDPDSANVKALQDTLLASAISKGFVAIAGSALEGTDDTGTISGGGLDGKGGRMWMLHDNEGVVTKKGNKKYDGLVGAMNSGDVGDWFSNNMINTPLSRDKNYDTFGLLAQKIDSIEKVIKNRPTTSTNLDNMGNVLQTTYRNGVKNTVKYLNSRPRI